jgi:hypothetical protein
LAARLSVIDSWAWGFDPAPPGIDREHLARAPVDFARFLSGVVLDGDLLESVETRSWVEVLDLAARAAEAFADLAGDESITNELYRRALDRRRDPLTRARFLSLLTALYDIEIQNVPGIAENRTTGVPGHAGLWCAFAVLASNSWTIAEAHARCVGLPRQDPDHYVLTQGQADTISAMKFIDDEPR